MSFASVDQSDQIAHLIAQLEQAQRRADVAEAQLRRVHAAVRDFKQRQLNAQRDAAAAQALRVVPEKSWGTEDPTLDVRFDEFINGEGAEDAARKWILADD